MELRQQQTSLITILSSDHGRLRREQGDIDKRDLQKAIKYGTHQQCYGNRWKIEYDGIIFIATESKQQEVTRIHLRSLWLQLTLRHLMTTKKLGSCWR